MTNDQGHPLCTACDNAGTRICSGCKSIHYCSIACQKLDWPIHKIICKDYAHFATTRPDDSHRSCILFHPNETKPRFIWLLFEPGHNHPSTAHLAEFDLSEDRLKDGMVEEISNNTMLGRHIEPHHIKLSVPAAEKLCPCCNTDIDPSCSLVTVDQELADFFRGHVLAAGTHCPGDLEQKASSLDLGPVDFRHVVDGLRMLYCQCEEDSRGVLIKSDIKAVRLNCEADTQFMDRTGIEGVLETDSILLKESEIPSPVADKIGMPLIVRKLPPAVAWRDPRRPCRLINYKSGMLNPPHQSDHTGSLVLVRKDGKPLHPMHVHALFGYTAEKLKDPNLTGNACITADMLFPTRIDHVSKEDFQNYYTTTWQTYPIHDPFVPSPFDIQADKDDEGADVNMNHA